MSYDPTWGNEEGYCQDGDHFTTDYDSHGECREHGCPVGERESDE